MKIVVLGATGMYGSCLLRLLSQSPDLDVVGIARADALVARLPAPLRPAVRIFPDLCAPGVLDELHARERPDVVINCAGVVKQVEGARDPLIALPVNSILPHQLARAAAATGSRLIHSGTDCVFSGATGGYSETDSPDARDLYGLSKYLGDVTGDHVLTIRTSIIGHELGSSAGLLEWFLSQTGTVRGFRRAIFSGLPTVEMGRVIRDFILPNPSLTGLFHVAATPISKYDLLMLVREAYRRADIEIEADESIVIDRSLDNSKFRAATGYVAPDWPELVRRMHEFG